MAAMHAVFGQPVMDPSDMRRQKGWGFEPTGTMDLMDLWTVFGLWGYFGTQWDLPKPAKSNTLDGFHFPKLSDLFSGGKTGRTLGLVLIFFRESK